MRRGSSMSELDKLINGTGLPDLVRSTTATNRLSAEQAGSKGYDSLPHSPHLSRSTVNKTGSCSVRGSIGDLMNQKKYGSSSWSVRSETLVARTVPLSTVTPTKHSPPTPFFRDTLGYESLVRGLTCLSQAEEELKGPLTTAQRTQRLSKLIRAQRNTLEYASVVSIHLNYTLIKCIIFNNIIVT